MKRKTKRTFFPVIRLAQLISLPGGIRRADAIERAQREVETLRDQSVTAIDQAIAEVDAIMADAVQGRLTRAQMGEVLRRADRVVTLAGTFGYDSLKRVAEGLCDVTDALMRANKRRADPIAVHVRSLLLLAPKADPLTTAQIEQVHAELAKVLGFFHVEHFSAADVGPDLADATAAAS